LEKSIKLWGNCPLRSNTGVISPTIILTSNQYHRAYDAKIFEGPDGERRMKLILDCFLSLVTMDGDVLPQDVKDAIKSISDDRVRQIIESKWIVDSESFQLNLRQFNNFRRELRETGANNFLNHRFSEVYDRYDGGKFKNFLDSLEPISSINSFEDIDYWGEYFTSNTVFREYIHYLGNELGEMVYANWW
jgi:hypothetical protein